MIDNSSKVKVNGRWYQIQKMTPLVAVRVHGWLVSAFAASQKHSPLESSDVNSESSGNVQSSEDQARDAVKALWFTAGGFMAEATMERIQLYCLRCCSSFAGDSDLPVPVITVDGRISDKELEQDATAVSELILQSLQASIAPFFTAHIAAQVS
jgi:hypothetical protein